MVVGSLWCIKWLLVHVKVSHCSSVNNYSNICQNNPTESPFKAIEEMARQALEAASGEDVTTSTEDVDQPTAHPPPEQPKVMD